MSCVTDVTFEPLHLDHQDLLRTYLAAVTSGISEFTFAGLYLFRNTYDYAIGFQGDLLLVRGRKEGQRFCLVPRGLPSEHLIQDLLNQVDYLKNLSEDQVAALRPVAEARGWFLLPDRDNWDYLFDTREMATLAGKRFHKKRNLVHQFYHQYHALHMEPLTAANLDDARAVLDVWTRNHPDTNDVEAASEALERIEELGLDGAVFYVDDEPAAYTLGEPSPRPGDYVIHFEKADARFKGIYQAVFQRFAQSLVGRFERINREQDLGDPGLRQAKETYRPVGFVKKYRLLQHAPSVS